MFLTNMRASFTYFDTDRSGSLDLKEIHQAVTRAGFQLDEHAFYAACKAFDPDRTATLGEAEFIGLTVFLQSCKGIFGTFDPQNTGSATFNYSQVHVLMLHGLTDDLQVTSMYQLSRISRCPTT